MNTHQKVKQSTKSTTWRFYVAFVMLCEESGQTCGQQNFQLHHDNAPAHSAHVVQAFLAKNSMPLIRQAPYSPDLAPCDFWLFPKLKTTGGALLRVYVFSVTLPNKIKYNF